MKIDMYSGSLSDVVVSASPVLGQPAAMVTTPVIAQKFEDNFGQRSGEILSNFVESGQLWALLIGVVLGYAIRGMTTY